MTAVHWKTCYNQMIWLQVPATEATRDNMINQVMNNIFHSEDIVYHSTGNVLPPATSSGII